MDIQCPNKLPVCHVEQIDCRSCKRGIMKRLFLTLTVLAIALLVSVPASYAQGAAKTGPDPSTIRDAELEKDSLHNLEVARHYFKLKKATSRRSSVARRSTQVIPISPRWMRCFSLPAKAVCDWRETGGKQTTKEALPDSLQATEKQATTFKTPQELRVDARVYLSRLVADYPKSAFRKQAESDLQSLGGPVKAGETPVSNCGAEAKI